jgi:hypothetical protein
MEYKNILLINPLAGRWKQHKVKQRAVPLGLPLGLGFLASFLEDKK